MRSIQSIILTIGHAAAGFTVAASGAALAAPATAKPAVATAAPALKTPIHNQLLQPGSGNGTLRIGSGNPSPTGIDRAVALQPGSGNGTLSRGATAPVPTTRPASK